MPMSSRITQDQAESTALQALAYLASDIDLLPRFLALSGIEAAQIRQAAAEPGFLAGVLAFFLAHEPSLLKLCEATGFQPQEIAAAARELPSGDDAYDRST
jgi:hypothetical protein